MHLLGGLHGHERRSARAIEADSIIQAATCRSSGTASAQQNAQLVQRVHQPDTYVPTRDDLEVAVCKLPATSSTPAKPCLRLVQRPRTVGSPPQHELHALLAPTMTDLVNASLISCVENYDDASSHV